MTAKNKFIQKEVTAKERLLKKIRQALLQKRDNPYPQLEETSLFPGLADAPELVFAQQLHAAGGHFVFCEDEVQLIESLLTIVEGHQLRKMYVWDPVLQQQLDRYGFPYYHTDAGFSEADAGITGCEVLIARSGSILLSNGNASGRRLGIFPPLHIVMAKTDQIVPDLKEAFAFLRQKYGGTLPSMVSTITGPSRTADIEKTLVQGAHGPKELFVLLVD